MSATPIYEDKNCPLCDKRGPRMERDAAGRVIRVAVCADCSADIPTDATDYAYRNMGGQGFLSHTADHRHAKVVKGTQGFGEAKRELCIACYRLDFAKAYPGADCRV